MDKIGGKRQRLHDSISKARVEGNGSSVPKWFLFVNMVMVLGAFITGLAIADYSYVLANGPEPENLTVDGFRFYFVGQDHPDMKGNYGFTKPYDNRDIWIDTGLVEKGDWRQVYRTCVHEKLHNFGLEGGESRGHEWLNSHENIDDLTCIRLVDNLKN